MSSSGGSRPSSFGGSFAHLAYHNFPDFALISTASNGPVAPVRARVVVDDPERPRHPNMPSWALRPAAKVTIGRSLLTFFCRFAPHLGVGPAQALSKIGRLVLKKKGYTESPYPPLDGEPSYEIHFSLGISLHNHEEIGELILSIAKDL